MTRRADRPKLKRFRYRDAVEWIAWNDEPTIMDNEEMSSLISVALMADLYGVTPTQFAADVIRYRAAQREQQRRREAILERKAQGGAA